MRGKKKHKIILEHGWLSVTLDLLFHACLLALSHSGRHGRTTTAVCTCCCCYYGVAVLRLVVVLLFTTTASLVCKKTEENKK